ncbi:MAG: RNA-dependent RNA polymerase [Sanya Iflavirus 7]|nr:MAG: RNA-dependent RNA polymerase [Sanya Iflavirus 7]
MKEQALQDFLKIKSPSQLNPNMAALHDKNLRIAPELFYINCNKSYPDPIGVDKGAFWRRRDVVIEAELLPHLQEKFGMLKDHEVEIDKILKEDQGCIADFDHLQFKIYNDVTDQLKGTGQLYTYDALKTKLKKMYKKFFDFQTQLFRQAQEEYTNSWDDTDDFPVSLRDIREEHRRAMKFLAEFGPAPNISLKQFFSVCKLYSKGSILTDEEKKLIVELGANAKIHHHRAQNTPPIIPIAQPDGAVASTSSAPTQVLTTSQCPLIRSPHTCPSTHMIEYERIPFAHPDRTPEQIKTRQDGVKKLFKDKLNVDLALLTYELSENSEIQILQRTNYLTELLLLSHGAFTRITGERNGEDFRVTFHEHKEYECTYYLDMIRCSVDGSPDRFKPLTLFCEHELVVGDCKLKKCNKIFCSVLWKHVPLRCNCHHLELGSTWDPDEKVFKSFSHDPINPFRCINENCLMKKDGRYQQHWVRHNRTAVTMGRVPEEWDSKIMRFNTWVAGVVPVFAAISVNSLIQKHAPTYVYNLYCAISFFIPWLSVAWGASKIMNWLIPRGPQAPFEEEVPLPRSVLMEMAASGDISRSAQHFKNIKPTFRSVARLQSAPLVNANTSAIISKIKKNTYIMTSKKAEEAGLYEGLRVFFMYQNVVCFQRHFFEFIKEKNLLENCDWVLTNPITKAKFPVDPSKWQIELPSINQLGYARVTEAPHHRSLLSNIASEKAHERSFGDCLMVHITADGISLIPLRPRKKEGITVNDSWGTYRTNVVYAYDWSSPGYCSSILLNPSLQQPIIGVHVAGNPLEGYAEPISNGMYGEWVDIQVEEFETEAVYETSDLNKKMTGDFIPIGKLHPSFAKHESGVTREKPSLVSGKYFPVVTSPAPLANNDPRFSEPYSPLYAGVCNMFKPPRPFDPSVMENFCDHYSQQLIINAEPLVVEPKVLDLNDAILGIPGFKYYDGLDMRTSEGFPLSRQRPPGVSNKSWLFEIEGEGEDRVIKSMYGPLLEIIKHDQNLRKCNIKPLTIFEDCLKDARLPLSKVLTPGKTRIFSSSPVQFSIIFKCYFTDFMAAFMNARLKLNHAIGIAPDGPEWGLLVAKMHEGNWKNNNFMSGDYKNFGPTLSMQAMHYACKSILRWCKHYYGNTTEQQKEDHRVRRILLMEIIESVHLCHDNLYQVVCGAPSGSPITVILNEIVNEFYMFAAYHSLAKLDAKVSITTYESDGHWTLAFLTGGRNRVHRDLSSIDNYDRLVKKCGYGDDIIFNVHDSVADFFSQGTLSSVFFALWHRLY